MKKKIIALIMAIMLLPAQAVNVFGSGDVLDKVVIFDAPIEGSISASTGVINGNNMSVYTEGNRGDVLRLNSTASAASFEVRTSGASECEATVISMDASFDRTTCRSYMDIFDGLSGSTSASQTARGWYITQEGIISYFESFMPPTGTRVQSDMRYEANEWYHLDLWIDYAEMKAYYFVNGIEIGCVPFDKSPQFIRGFRITVDQTGGGANYYFDNIKIVDFKNRGASTGVGEIMGIPDNFTSTAGIEYKTNENNLGFIFTDKEVHFKGIVINNKEETKNVEIKTIITDEDGNIADERVISKSLSARQKDSFEVTTTLEKFGFYYLNTLVFDGITGEKLYDKKFQFSVINAPSGVKNDKFGFADHTGTGHGVEEMERKVEQMAEMGVKTLRIELNKHNTDYISGSYELDDAHKRLIELAVENGMDIIGILTYGKVPPVTSEEYLEWEKYVKSVVGQVKGKCNNITYEVWNEYNGAGFNYIGATSLDYVNLLKTTYSAVKDVDKTAKIAGFVVSPINIEDDPETVTIDAIDWVEEVLQHGGGDYMDRAAIHVYTHKYPENTSTARGKFLGEVRDLLDKYGYSDMEIDITEIGWTTDGIVSERNQANWIVRWMVMNYNNADRVCWYVNQEKQTASDFENLYGFTRPWSKQYAGEYPIYGAKPAYVSAANYNTQMSGVEFVEKCQTESNTYVYKFIDGAGNYLYVAWKRGSKAGTEIAVGGGEVSVSDVYGNPYSYEKTADGVSVVLSESPVYIRERDGEPTFDIYIDYNEETITLSGYTKGSGDRVGISVIGAEEDENKPLSLAYIGQTKADSFGKYSFTFKNNIISGNYIAKVGFGNGTLTKEIDLSVSVPTLRVSSDGVRIKNIAQLNDGDEIKINWAGLSDVLQNNDGIAAVAMYEGEILKNIVSHRVDKGESEIEMETKFVSGTDCIKIIFWDADSYKPLTAMQRFK